MLEILAKISSDKYTKFFMGSTSNQPTQIPLLPPLFSLFNTIPNINEKYSKISFFSSVPKLVNIFLNIINSFYLLFF